MTHASDINEAVLLCHRYESADYTTKIYRRPADYWAKIVSDFDIHFRVINLVYRPQPRQAVATPRQQKEKCMQKQARQYATRETKCWITTAAEDQWETGWRLYKKGKRRQTTSTEDVNWRKLYTVHKVLTSPATELASDATSNRRQRPRGLLIPHDGARSRFAGVRMGSPQTRRSPYTGMQ